jgi:hypothetical protein
MLRFNNNIGITQITGAELDLPGATRLAEQMSHFMAGVHNFYMHDLGLERVDTDPPPGDPGDIEWRIDGLRRSGDVETNGIAFIGAFALRADGTPSDEPDALKGLLVLNKPEGTCTDDEHQPTDILEWDVVEGLRGSGLGRTMLREGLTTVHPEDTLTLDVAENNLAARAIYQRYGFVPTSQPPMEHGIFAVRHVQMWMPAAALQGRLQQSRSRAILTAPAEHQTSGDESMPGIVNKIIGTME